MAWKDAPLLHVERQCLLLHYGFGWTAEEIGFNQGVTSRSVNKRLKAGVDCMTKWLNAEYGATE
jgi:DNA-directed RNA polymerase specialized sigma24 family protein